MKEIIDFLKRYTDGKQNTEKVEISVLQLNRVIKALEQERSRLAEITQYRHDCEKLMEENERLKKALEQEPVLDKIRAEIESQREEASKKHSEDEGLSNYYFGLNDGLKDARDIIDKYIAESEDE